MNGTHHKGREGDGYSFAVSGLVEMTTDYEDMLKAEARYWLKFRQHDPDAWIKQLARMSKTRGTVFTERLETTMNEEQMT